MKEETDEGKMLQSMMEMYEIEYEQAKKSLDAFLAKLREAGVLEE